MNNNFIYKSNTNFGNLCIYYNGYQFNKKTNLPVVWAFMKRRRKRDKVFKALKKFAISLNLDLKPVTIMVDFERAAIISFKKNFKNVQIKGCLFHFSQSLYKNLSKHHLTESYINCNCFYFNSFSFCFNFRRNPFRFWR